MQSHRRVAGQAVAPMVSHGHEESYTDVILSQIDLDESSGHVYTEISGTQFFPHQSRSRQLSAMRARAGFATSPTDWAVDNESA